MRLLPPDSWLSSDELHAGRAKNQEAANKTGLGHSYRDPDEDVRFGEFSAEGHSVDKLKKAYQPRSRAARFW